MPISEQQRKILDLVAAGKITAADAEKLFAAMGGAKLSKRKKIVFLLEEEDKEKLKLQIPLSLAKAGAKWIPAQTELQTQIGSSRFNLHDINWKEIMEMAVSGEDGELFYLDIDDDSGKRKTIRIFVA